MAAASSHRAYVAEFLGAFTLTLAVSLSITQVFPVPTPLIAGLTLGLFVYTIGAISGAHINPAVTVSLWSVGKIRAQQAVSYIVAQLIGGAAALFLLLALHVTAPVLIVQESWSIAFAEAVGTFVLAFAVSSVVRGRTPSDAAGLTIGGSLALGALLASGLGSSGVLNPAVALGLGTLNFSYALGPIAGAVAAAWVYRWLAGKGA